MTLIVVAGVSSYAQQTPTQPAASAANANSALDDPLIQQADDEQVPPALFSRITLKYDHLMFSNGADADRIRVSGQQTFGPRKRLGVAYEIPYFNIHGGENVANGEGLGDIKLEFNYLLSKSQRFSQAARVEFTFPSASNNVIGLGQNILKLAYGFSTPLGSRTVLNGTLGYNKGMTAPAGKQGFNTLEPQAVLAHKFANSLAGFLDWDTYEDFNADQFGQTLKAGLTIQLGRKGKWAGTPYAQFPLNHFTSSTNLKTDIGFDLDFRY